MELTPQMQKQRTAQFYNCYVPTFTDGTHATEFDGETLPAIYDKLGKKILEGKSVCRLLQAIHNIYAKKLGIAPVRVMKMNSLDCPAAFSVWEFLSSDNRSVILYSDAILFCGPLTAFNAIIHETKHAHQAYNTHNFVKFGIVPKTDKEKLLLLNNFFWNYRFTASDKLQYYLGLYEIDAYFYEFAEMRKLNERHPEKFNGFAYYYNMWDKLTAYLTICDYKKDGLNSKGLKQVYKAMKTDIYRSLRGDYGIEMQKLCKEVLESGFNLENAFGSLIEELDYMYDQTILLAHEVRSMGLQAKFEKNGNLMYSKTKVSHLNRRNMSSNLEKTFFHLSNDIDDEFIYGKQK